ncbi:hypothetical protein RUND412_008773 [Rhizina undulata]
MSLLRTFLPKSSPRALRITPTVTHLTYRQFSTTPLARKFNDGSSKNVSLGRKAPLIQENNPSELFSEFDVLGSIPPPASAIETIYDDGFLFQSGIKVRGGDGVLLVNNEVFRWRPAIKGSEVERKAKTGVLELDEDVWGLLDVIHPKPDLLIIGTGARTLLLSPKTRKRISELGIAIDAMDTRHAAAQYNLLSTERAGGQVAAALMVESFTK